MRAILIKRRTTQEGEVIPLYQYDLMLGEAAEVDDRLFMVWPVIIEHRINEDSPFWDLSADSLQQESFELVVVLEGIVESTGMTAQARTSYLPNEVPTTRTSHTCPSYEPAKRGYNSEVLTRPHFIPAKRGPHRLAPHGYIIPAQRDPHRLAPYKLALHTCPAMSSHARSRSPRFTRHRLAHHTCPMRSSGVIVSSGSSRINATPVST